MRVMPNTPALVQCGASVYVPGNWATDEDEKLTARLLSSVGTAERVQEYLMDPITALSGSGPAYVSLKTGIRTQGCMETTKTFSAIARTVNPPVT